MIQIHVMNLKSFLEVINQCKGKVFLIREHKKKTNITRQYIMQQILKNQYQQNDNYLPVSLEFEEVCDYFSAVYNYIANC